MRWLNWEHVHEDTMRCATCMVKYKPLVGVEGISDQSFWNIPWRVGGRSPARTVAISGHMLEPWPNAFILEYNTVQHKSPREMFRNSPCYRNRLSAYYSIDLRSELLGLVYFRATWNARSKWRKLTVSKFRLRKHLLKAIGFNYK